MYYQEEVLMIRKIGAIVEVEMNWKVDTNELHEEVEMSEEGEQPGNIGVVGLDNKSKRNLVMELNPEVHLDQEVEFNSRLNAKIDWNPEEVEFNQDDEAHIRIELKSKMDFNHEEIDFNREVDLNPEVELKVGCKLNREMEMNQEIEQNVGRKLNPETKMNKDVT